MQASDQAASATQQLAEACAAVEEGWNEADLRHRLWEFFGPWARNTLGLPQSALSHEGTGLTGRFDSRIGRAVIEYKRPGALGADEVGNRQAAAEQALKYLDDSTLGLDVVVITDGETWAHYRDATADIELMEQGTLDLGLSADGLPPKDRFVWRSNNQDGLTRVLELIATVRTEPVSARAIASKLGTGRPEVRQLISKLASSLRSRESDDRADVLFRQWLAMAGVSYGISDTDSPWPDRTDAESMLGEVLAEVLTGCTYAESLYTLHTYVAFAAKAVGIELLALGANRPDRRPTSWASLDASALANELRRIDDDTLVAELRSPGLFAGDLFGWFGQVLPADPELVEAFRQVLKVLDELAWARVVNRATGIAGDVLREFYMHIVPRPLRRALGEFFTPQWVADRTLQQAVDAAERAHLPCRVLDPACGSGTFLVTALRRELMVEEGKSPDGSPVSTRAALERVTGFDINPVSVLMSRINLLLALGDRIESMSDIVPQVYQTDSILVPDREQLQMFKTDDADQQPLDSDLLHLTLSVGRFGIPSALATQSRIRALRDALEVGVRQRRDVEVWKVELESRLRAEGLDEDELASAIEPCCRAFEAILELSRLGKNGVWARIIEQYFAPAMYEPADIVVGNPPWINWKHLPESWQEDSKAAWEKYGLWATKQGSGGIPLSDISVLMMARSIAHYAAPDGIVALVLPEAVLLADPGNRRIRRCTLSRDQDALDGVSFAPLRVDDWTSLKPFSLDAANNPITLYVQRDKKPSWPVVKHTWRRHRSGTRLNPEHPWSSIKPLIECDEVPIEPLDRFDPGARWAPVQDAGVLRSAAVKPDYRWGQGFHTRGADAVFTVEIESLEPDRGRVTVTRHKPRGSKEWKPDPPNEDSELLSPSVEAAYLWPLVRGRDVHRFRVDPSGLYAILAHKTDDLRTVMTDLDLAADAPRLLAYLSQFKEQLSRRSAYMPLTPAETPYGVIGPTPHIKRTKPIVICRYIAQHSRPPAAVVTPQMDDRLGFATVCYPNNKVNVLVCESEDEAHFVAAWINSEAAQNAISAIASSTTIGPNTLEKLALPQYDATDSVHRDLSALGKSAAAGAPVDDDQLDELVRQTLA